MNGAPRFSLAQRRKGSCEDELKKMTSKVRCNRGCGM